jgi:hypothetical protein
MIGRRIAFFRRFYSVSRLFRGVFNGCFAVVFRRPADARTPMDTKNYKNMHFFVYFRAEKVSNSTKK